MSQMLLNFNEIAHVGLCRCSVGLPLDEVERQLIAAGATRVVFQPDASVLVYYLENDIQRWMICAPNEIRGS